MNDLRNELNSSLTLSTFFFYIKNFQRILGSHTHDNNIIKSEPLKLLLYIQELMAPPPPPPTPFNAFRLQHSTHCTLLLLLPNYSPSHPFELILWLPHFVSRNRSLPSFQSPFRSCGLPLGKNRRDGFRV